MADMKNPHDRVFRGSMSDMKVARPFIEFYMLNEVTQDLDLSTLKLLPTSNINSRLDESISDLVYSCKYKDDSATNGKSEVRIIILVEHQSTPDKFMPVRVYDYIFGLWINELKANNKIELLPACHALVFYHGEQTPYPYTMDLTDCIDDPKDRMQSFWQNTVQLVEVEDYSDEQLLAQKLDGVLSLALKHSREADLTDIVYLITKRLSNIDAFEHIELEFIKRLMFYLWRTQGKIDKEQLTVKLDELNQPIGGEVMTFVEQLREEGQEVGRFNEKIDMAINCLKEGASFDFIAKVTGLPIEKVNALAKEHKLH